MAQHFDSWSAENRNGGFRVICKLRGFDPKKGHTAEARIEKNELIITATMNGEQYQETMVNARQVANNQLLNPQLQNGQIVVDINGTPAGEIAQRIEHN